jgi:hypothetical protein
MSDERLSIFLGFMVGHAVRLGSDGYGGLAFQFLAVWLTYCAIAGTHTPEVAKGLMQDEQVDAPEPNAARATRVRAMH